jgi:hypothetical protein
LSGGVGLASLREAIVHLVDTIPSSERGDRPGVDVDGIAQTETDHFGNCPVCGALIDMCDLAHVHEKAPAIGDGCQSREETQCNSIRGSVMCRNSHTHRENSWNRLVRKGGADLTPRPLLCRGGGLLGLSVRSAPFGFTIRRLAIAHGDQFFFELRPFVGGHGGLFVLRQIFHREISTCFRRRRCLGPRVHR